MSTSGGSAESGETRVFGEVVERQERERKKRETIVKAETNDDNERTVEECGKEDDAVKALLSVFADEKEENGDASLQNSDPTRENGDASLQNSDDMTIPKLDDGDNERDGEVEIDIYHDLENYELIVESEVDVSADLARWTMQEEVKRKESMPQHVPKHSEDELVTGYPTALPVTISTHKKHVEVMNRVATNFLITIASGWRLKHMDTSRDTIVVALTREGEHPEDDRGYLVVDTRVFKELTALPEMKEDSGRQSPPRGSAQNEEYILRPVAALCSGQR